MYIPNIIGQIQGMPEQNENTWKVYLLQSHEKQAVQNLEIIFVENRVDSRWKKFSPDS